MWEILYMAETVVALLVAIIHSFSDFIIPKFGLSTNVEVFLTLQGVCVPVIPLIARASETIGRRRLPTYVNNVIVFTACPSALSQSFILVKSMMHYFKQKNIFLRSSLRKALYLKAVLSILLTLMLLFEVFLAFHVEDRRFSKDQTKPEKGQSRIIRRIKSRVVNAILRRPDANVSRSSI